MRYRPDLDGIRALAVLAVILAHSPIERASGGWMGVDIFFVLSGYLITALLLSERAGTGTVSLRRFYARRALRLYPALLLVLTAGVFFYRDLGDGGTLTGYGKTALAAGLYVEDLVAGLGGTLAGELGHTWSLAVEEQFYIIWPPVMLLLVTRGRDPLRWALAGAAISAALLAVGSRTAGWSGGPDAFYLPWDRFSQLLIGCCVAILLTRRTTPRWLRPPPVGWALIAAAGVLIVAAGKLHRYPHLGWEAPAIGVLTAAVILHLDIGGRGLRSALGCKPLAYIGRRSYGIYLIHYPVFQILYAHTAWGKVEVTAADVAISLALAIASYQLVELPFLRLKHRRFEPPSHRPEPVPT